MIDSSGIKPEPYTKEEEEYLEYLIKKHGKRLGTKKEKYQVFQGDRKD